MIKKYLSIAFYFLPALLIPVAPIEASSTGPVIHVPAEELASEVSAESSLDRKIHLGDLRLFGYGELHYNASIGPTANQIDFHRFVLGLGYDFTRKIKLEAELDFEHAFEEPELEFAYVDFLLRDWINFRTGSILVPMGVINQHHEPPLFYSVERPEIYRVIIPTSWMEGGTGIHGKIAEGLHYQLYGLTSPSAMGFTGSNGIRGGRGKVGTAPGGSFGAAARLEYVGVPGLRVGSSTFLGGTGHGDPAFNGPFLTMLEGDAKYSLEGIDLEGLFAFTNLSSVGSVNTTLVRRTPTFTNFVAKQMMGWYLEGAYHLFHHIMPDTKHDLVAFVRYEDYNTQHKMGSTFAANRSNDRNTLTFGASYLPIPQVAIKADYMANWNQANAGVDQFNVGIGFYY